MKMKLFKILPFVLLLGISSCRITTVNSTPSSSSISDSSSIHAHSWGTPTYEWNDDNSKCTATRMCIKDNDHIETETVDSTFEIIIEPTYTTEGLGRYTASFINSSFSTQTKEAIIPVLSPEPTLDKLSFVLNDDDKSYSVKAKGASISGEVVIPSTYNGLPVTLIDNGAFYNCSSLTSITIPDSVTWIGNDAFGFCFSLTSITIPDSVTWIGNDAFGYCSSLTYNEYDNGCYLGNPSNPYLILVKVKSKNIESCNIHENTKIIYDLAFYCCSSLTSITIPDSVTWIGNNAFDNCSSLTSITIPDSVTWIGNNTFGYCSSLTSITIPNSVTSIGSYAFYNCSSLTSATIGNSVTWIGNNAFDNCSSLTSITIPDSVTSIGEDAFYNCSSLTSVTIGNSVTSIDRSAFYNCYSLTSVTIGNSVTSIGNYAFDNCSSLTSITIPNSVTSIERGAFYNCSSLTSITIPNSVTSIGNNAFYNCSSLATITFNGSIEKWNSIQKGGDWKYNVPGSCIVHCTDGDINI